MNRIKLIILVWLFALFSGYAHHIVNGVEVKLPEPDKDPAKIFRF